MQGLWHSLLPDCLSYLMQQKTFQSCSWSCLCSSGTWPWRASWPATYLLILLICNSDSDYWLWLRLSLWLLDLSLPSGFSHWLWLWLALFWFSTLTLFWIMGTGFVECLLLGLWIRREYYSGCFLLFDCVNVEEDCVHFSVLLVLV